MARATVQAYDAHAAAYRDGTNGVSVETAAQVSDLVATLGPGARVLEIGSGGGRDAAVLEQAGLSVRRTDITPAFVDLLREAGHEATLLDPLIDDLADPRAPGAPYDGVWASASLLHVDRSDLSTVLRRLAEATRPGGALLLWLKEGDGAAWSTHGFVGARRRFVYWREAPLRTALESSGWTVDRVEHTVSSRTGEPWLDVRATRA